MAAGALATAVVKLAAALADHGKSCCVVTTNYDEFIEEEAGVLAQNRKRRGLPPVELRTSVIELRDPHPDFEIADHVEPGQILHLHGFVPNRAGEATDVVLSEKDYMASQAAIKIALHTAVVEGVGDQVEFCVGGPSSNHRTAAHLRWLLPGVSQASYEEDPKGLALRRG
ncbi:SIR2 family protein [Lentzea sp. NEAU-D7]|uniref:SIR2 family protein n=1 Tax=Lentzea sp. NEAU-D7 TaxID=2994667 RepID=UPI00224AD5AA|nr:SIR2 family protein [Lentzea sp. NEAU-D7]MCX2950190.1 SIR2 family protein [Lentzea sp. NEAU-D7]